ncbi:fused response regulator/thioredoxin-disulfide reductase [Nocardioides sp. Soil774]|uniref:FAD-dependent oxidoreductase n=1 Tax=Nocardioides sp. Soil774 TaxID=1736408 RepID=UPI0006FCF3ED|nr:FAD-dependent oxidoreductase [Nocardioides sp. Soil774]KRE95448.1 fused response regulator/thioredoxin-disulfide reductase [Nocardioides sp. Soil774]
MAKPAILAIDDDVAVVAAVVRDLRQRYGEDHRVLRATSGAEALEILADQLLKDRPIAAVVSDQRMPQMSGIEVLKEVRQQSPDSKLVLLTAYADTDVAIRAINDIALDYYLMKPWDPPEERLYPVLDDLLRDWAHDHPDRDSEVRVVGHRWSERTVEVKTFLTHNHVPYRWLEVDQSDEAARLLELAGAGTDDLPVVALPDGVALRSPTTVELADALGLHTRAEKPLYDLCIVGGGPAGLAAAVYAASEGLATVVVERDAPGGQAGQSASIENYLGFPKGLSGADLTHRAVAQASRFGAEMVLTRDVVGFETRGPVRAVLLDGSADIEARAVLVASGVSYRRLEAPGLDALVGRGLHYGASASEAAQTVGEDVYVVGAANSAGQAALNFARYAKRVVLVVRGASLEASMSQYLVGRILTAPNVEVRLRTEVGGARGDGHLEALTLVDRDTGDTEEVETSWVFVFIGAAPHTDWLGDAVARDDHGFVLTGPDLPGDVSWPLERGPFALETSVPGVFAAGDVRRDSMKRVASAVGEGAMSVYLVHRYLAQT